MIQLTSSATNSIFGSFMGEGSHFQFSTCQTSFQTSCSHVYHSLSVMMSLSPMVMVVPSPVTVVIMMSTKATLMLLLLLLLVLLLCPLIFKHCQHCYIKWNTTRQFKYVSCDKSVIPPLKSQSKKVVKSNAVAKKWLLMPITFNDHLLT